MPPITKDSDAASATPETSRSGSSAASVEESGTKAQPVALEVPITVNGARTAEGSDRREPFLETTRTVMVHGSGAVIRLNSALAPGQLLFLTNERTKREVVCQVVKSKNYRSASGYVELEFTEPAVGFWGMRFPGDRIGPGPQAPPEASRPAATNASAALSRPAAPKFERASTSRDANGTTTKSSSSPPVLPKPASPPASAPSSVSAALDAGSSWGGATSKPLAGIPARPLAGSFGAEEPLVEPWLKKRAPVSQVPSAPPTVASREPAAKTEPPSASLSPVRDFELARPSDKPASLFAPSEPAANPATVDLSSLTPFFEVKPAPANPAPAEPPGAPPASVPETEELKHHTARLQQELSQLQFSEPVVSLPAKPAEVETPSFPLTEQSISAIKAELVHESPARLVGDARESHAPAVLPEAPKLEEPLKVEPPAPIPALESLEQEEMRVPAWLEPLARNASAPSSTKELVLREKAKRVAEQPPLKELMAPLAAPIKAEPVAEARLPQLGSVPSFEEGKKAKGRESSPKKSRKGMAIVALAAGTVLVAGGAWWYRNEQGGGVHAGTSATQEPTNSMSPAAPSAVLPVHRDAASAAGKPSDLRSDAPASTARDVSSPAPTSATTAAARNSQSASNSSHPGNVVTATETVVAEPVPEEKKPVLGEVHLEAPKIAHKRTAQNSAEPDAGISLTEDEPEGDANALSAELGAANKQPAAPAAPVEVGGEVRQARLISSVPPEYPAMAKAQHISGGVTIDALIEANGRVTKMKVISGPTLLQQAAMEALRQWKYQPATLDGKAVPMHLTVTIQFRLQQ